MFFIKDNHIFKNYFCKGNNSMKKKNKKRKRKANKENLQNNSLKNSLLFNLPKKEI